MIPWIQFRTILPGVIGGAGVGSYLLMSDILFLAVKEHAGKLRSDEGFLSGIGDLATLTANTGKDMYLARAQVTFFLISNTGVAYANNVVLKVNGTPIETTEAAIGGHAGTSNGTGAATLVYDFKNIGHKVAAGDIIKLEVIALNAAVDVEGFIECFEETTGESPYNTTEFPVGELGDVAAVEELEVHDFDAENFNSNASFIATKRIPVLANQNVYRLVHGSIATTSASLEDANDGVNYQTSGLAKVVVLVRGGSTALTQIDIIEDSSADAGTGTVKETHDRVGMASTAWWTSKVLDFAASKYITVKTTGTATDVVAYVIE